MGLHEECGVFGVFADKPINVAGIAYYGLYALQHRGQESCGIVVNDDGVFASYKDLGLVSAVFRLRYCPVFRRVLWRLGTPGTVQPAQPTGITVSRLKSIIKREEWPWPTTATSPTPLSFDPNWNYLARSFIQPATQKPLAGTVTVAHARGAGHEIAPVVGAGDALHQYGHLLILPVQAPAHAVFQR